MKNVIFYIAKRNGKYIQSEMNTSESRKYKFVNCILKYCALNLSFFIFLQQLRGMQMFSIFIHPQPTNNSQTSIYKRVIYINTQ